MNRKVKVLIAIALSYVAIVVVFETLLASFQPRGDDNLVITYTDSNGNPSNRVLSLFESDGEIYLAANHWPRAWFRTVQENPNVHIEFGGALSQQSGEYLAVPISEEDRTNILADNPSSLVLRFLMGFPRREFLRLEAQWD